MSRKLLSIVLIIAMVLSLVSFAGASGFPDVSGATASSVTRLSGLGIIAGFPDGTFKPDNNITRAEFAKIAVLTMGLGTTADMLVNVPSKFKDVPAGRWFTGYVNLAADQGILKGYGDGTFRPSANITEAEALTIVLRLLGYNDELPGQWPFDYVVRANMINLIPVGFNAGGNARRGMVASLVSNALNATRVSWHKDTGFTNIPPGLQALLIGSSFGGAISPISDVNSVTLAAPAAMYHTMVIEAGVTDLTLNVSKDVKVAGGVFGPGLANHKVVYTTRLIAGVVVVVAIEVQSTSVSGRVTAVNSVTRAVTVAGTVVDYSAITGALPAVNDEVTVWIYLGKAYRSTPIVPPTTGIVTGKRTLSHTAGTLPVTTITNYVTIGTEFVVAANAVITRNGAVATFANILPGDSVTYRADGANITMLSAWNVTVSGLVSSWTKNAAGQYTSITVDGVAYSAVVPTTGTIGLPSGPPPVTDVPIGVRATFSLDAQNRIMAMLSAESFATTVTGTIAGTSIGSSLQGPVYFVTLTSGVTYDVTAAVTATQGVLAGNLFKNTSEIEFASLFAPSGAVAISYNARGIVEKVAVFAPNADVAHHVANGAIRAGTTTFTHNGRAALTLVASADVFRINWDGVTDKALSISSADFTNPALMTDAALAVTGTGSVQVGAAVTNYFDIGASRFNFAANAVVLKNGVASSFAAITVGDNVRFVVENSVVTYVEATTPQ